MANLTIRPWDDFTAPAAYSIPRDVNTIFERMRLNLSHYLGNYLMLAGGVLTIGVLFNFWVFFTLALAIGAGYGAWFGLMTYVPQLKPNSLPILGGTLVLGFYIGLKSVGEEYSFTVWQYFVLSSLPALLHAIFKKRNPVAAAANKVSGAVRDIKRDLR